MKIKKSYKLIETVIKSGEKIKSYRISINEAKLLLENFEGWLQEDISNSRDKFYLLNNNFLLQILKNSIAELYYSKEDYLLFLKDTQTTVNQVASYRYFINKNGIIKRFTQVTYKEAHLILEKDKIWSKLILKKSLKPNAYQLNNGSILLLKISDKSPLFESEIDYNDYIETLSGNILKGLNPYQENFPNYVSQLIAELAKSLHIPLNQLNGTIESIDLIDTKISQIVVNDLFFLENILPIIAYLGHVYILNKKGEWYMEYDDTVWMPSILTQSKKKIRMWLDIYDGLSPNEAIKVPLGLIYSRF